MIFLVEALKEGQEKPRLGTDGKEIHWHYKSFQSLEKYCIRRLLKKYDRIWVSVFYADNIYGEPQSVWEYSKIETYRGFEIKKLSPEKYL